MPLPKKNLSVGVDTIDDDLDNIGFLSAKHLLTIAAANILGGGNDALAEATELDDGRLQFLFLYSPL